MKIVNITCLVFSKYCNTFGRCNYSVFSGLPRADSRL